MTKDAMRQPPPISLYSVEEDGELVLYLDFDGRPIAKRRSGETWTILDDRYTVTGLEPGGYDEITIGLTQSSPRSQ
jgi:hypothetical protein